MKKIYLLLALFSYVISTTGQTPVVLTFQAMDSLTQQALSLDSVSVSNLSEACDTTLFDAISILTLNALWPVGLAEPGSPEQGSFILMQNVPNPFQGSTLVRIYRKEEGALNLVVFDDQGNTLSYYRNTFCKGWHLFTISAGGTRILFLNVSDNRTSKTIRVISFGSGDAGVRISGNGSFSSGLNTLKSTVDEAGFIFYLGNQLKYTAYVGGYHESVLYDSPVSDETYTLVMLPVTTVTIPTVSTSPVTDITQTTATSGGNVTSDGGAAVTARGICWSASPNPTISGNHTTDGNGTGIFVSYLTGLGPNTPYYVRAYATNASGTAYGNEELFSTLPIVSLPVVSTAAVTNITPTTATSGGDVTFDGGAAVTARGVCWNTSPNPTLANNSTNDGPGTGVFVSYLTSLIPNTIYYIRAYAINSAGTAYGNELTFTTPGQTVPVVITTAAANISQFTATSGGNVTGDGGAFVTVRGVCWSTSPGPTTAGPHTIDGSGIGAFVSNLTGLTPNTPYYLRAYATNSVGTAYGNEITFTTLALALAAVTTTPATNITQTTAVSGGNVTSDGGSAVTARGVCWSTSASPVTTGNHTTDGSGTGSFVSNLSGLAPNTPYYIRAYAVNSVGTAYGNELTFTTNGTTFICGNSMTIVHVAGTVAPVTKTTTYGTVTNVPGEPAKCWITSNLGSDHQATSVSDATEESAGWYWQFNRKQGFKHDGATLTPNTWVTTINENYNWQPSNDPCFLELGSGWRVPTASEWTNVDASGNWTNWNGPWNSNLKMHAAGSLSDLGSLGSRGLFGQYWSGTQAGTTGGNYLSFNDTWSMMTADSKTRGFTLRCITE